jgi:hypothetical protein
VRRLTPRMVAAAATVSSGTMTACWCSATEVQRMELAPQGAGCAEPAGHRTKELALPGTGGLLLSRCYATWLVCEEF